MVNVTIPLVVAVVRDGLFVIHCPYCDREHSHGANAGGGHRLSHCRDNPQTYTLALAAPC